MLSTFTHGFSFQINTLRSSAHAPIVYISTKPAILATLFGDAVFDLLLELLPVDQVFLTAILVQYVCTQDGTLACFLRLHSFVARFLAVAWL